MDKEYSYGVVQTIIQADDGPRPVGLLLEVWESEYLNGELLEERLVDTLRVSLDNKDDEPVDSEDNGSDGPQE